MRTGVFTKLKVLLYTDKSHEVRMAVLAAMGTLMLGRETAAGPDDDLVVEICKLLMSEEDELVRPTLCSGDWRVPCETLEVQSDSGWRRGDCSLEKPDTCMPDSGSLPPKRETLQVAGAAKLLGRMIYQDYVKLNVVLHEGKNLPQSDNWGLCDG